MAQLPPEKCQPFLKPGQQRNMKYASRSDKNSKMMRSFVSQEVTSKMEFPERRMLLKSPFCHVLLQCPQILGACQNVTASAILVGARHLLYILYVTNSEPREFGGVKN